MGLTVNIIHSKERVDRYSLLKNEINRQGIVSYRIWDAIKTENNNNKNISKAHKQIVEYAMLNGLDEVIIAEDDFYFPHKDGFKYFLFQKPIRYDIYLSGAYTGIKNINQNNRIIGRFSGLHFYMVHKRFYQTFLSLPYTSSIDNELSLLSIKGLARISICYPMVAIQHETKSDNTGNIYKHKDFFKNGQVFGLKI